MWGTGHFASFKRETLEHVCGLIGRIKKRERLKTHEGEEVTAAAKHLKRRE